MTAAEGRPRALGILGGTFNPPHLGHLALARCAASQLGLEKVLLVPARVAPHKLHAADPGAAHRLAMCRLAAQGQERLEVCGAELDRPGPSYTVDTLRGIHSTDPQAELTLIMGADMAATLPSWREPEELLGLARIAVAERDSSRRAGVMQALDALDAPDRVVFLGMAPVEVSSSAVRARAGAGLALDGLVPDAVGAYISERGLYREGVAAHEGPA